MAREIATPPKQLRDQFGRIASDLRLSVTDRCNLRCHYCIPADATDWLAKKTLLTASEIGHLIRIGISLGVNEVRITGGEPLLRPDLPQIVSEIRNAFITAQKPPQIALTTNGIGLATKLPELIAAGLQRVNISLDTLDRQRFHQLTCRDRLDDTLAGIEAAVNSPLNSIKVNTVVLDQNTLAEIPQLVEYCLQRKIQWRAIEFMPIGPLARKQNAPTADQIFEKLTQHYRLEKLSTVASAPARRWQVWQPETDPVKEQLPPAGIVGIIASTSHPFCAHCVRTRLSADGKVYSCLFWEETENLRDPLRSGATDEEIAALWLRAHWRKPAGHYALAPVKPQYRMSKIGG